MIGVISAGGNTKSILNVLRYLGYNNIVEVKETIDLKKIEILFFPGVGRFGSVIEKLRQNNLIEPLKKYLKSNKPYVGICLGMQVLFESSEEDKNAEGLGYFKGIIKKIKIDQKKIDLKVPNVGWQLTNLSKSSYFSKLFNRNVICTYYMHSYALLEESNINDIEYTYISYGDKNIVSSINKKNIFAFQFHPEKSGEVGLKIFKNLLKNIKRK